MRWRNAALGMALLLVGCNGAQRYDQAICALIDVSGTYADEKREAVAHLKREILPNMVPGDTLIVIRIDSESYEKENVEALLTLDARPSHANAQKLALARRLDAFAEGAVASEFTDIPGAMMLGAEYLSEVGAGSRVMLIFSDMREELPKGSLRPMGEREFEGIQVIAMNVKQLTEDTANPDVFRRRIAAWEERVTARGALGWRTLMDSSKLPDYLAQIR
ncbi:MAG: hypothetical protein OEM49_00720 [Myxococcales bacterium]|nr:hypothetical protein [Myxococcales bacterium]MDH5306359.1 hypothetical protein [Myxococcales bacterium]MDH5566998.1 hypothetical protein [Myxococcales bacterium]